MHSKTIDVKPTDNYDLIAPLENEFKGNSTESSPNEFTPDHQTAASAILEKYEFRSIRPEEADQAAVIEQICFPPNEACSEQHMKERVAKAPELFLVVVDRSTGRLAGFLNGLATDEYIFRDEFFTDANLYNPAGKNIMLLGLDVLPEYRMQGIARELVCSYARRERENGRQMLILTCLKSKVKMYEKMGFADRGIANSTWGGEEWHEMSYRIGS
jgi:ribosomal protein S18 acetylase RimI-like enzyme